MFARADQKTENKTSLKVIQPPGGKTSNIFAADKSTEESPRNIFAANAKPSPTYASSPQSMFSKEELPPVNKPSPRANVQSQESPFNSNPSSTSSTETTSTSLPRRPSKVHEQSVASPFSNQPYEVPVHTRPYKALEESQQTYEDLGKNVSMANAQSAESPFSDGKPQVRPPTPRRASSIQTNPSGSKSNLNLFQEPPQVSPREGPVTPTYASSADSPFNKSGQDTMTHHRRNSSRVSETSVDNVAAHPELPPHPTTPRRHQALEPHFNSPFSTVPRDEKSPRPYKALEQSSEAPPRPPSVRVFQSGGGSQTFNIFSNEHPK